MFQPNPPAPKAMPDAELNSRIAELQLQANGLEAAMALIEEQSKLRQEDALEFSKWQLEAQMHAATQAEPGESFSLQDPASQTPVVPTSTEPEEEIPVSAIVSETVVVLPLAAGNAISSEPTSQPESIEDIVAALNASYAEVATESEISETPVYTPETPLIVVEEPQASEPEPVASSLPKESAETDLGKEWESENLADEDQVGPTRTTLALSWSWLAIASSPLALVVAALINDAGASLAQAVILLASVLLITSLLAAVGSLASVRASSSITVVSRAAFGVWGNALPATVMLVAKLFWATAFVYFATRVISPLIFNQPWFAGLAERLIFPGEFTAALFVLIPLVVAASVVSAVGGQIMLRLQQITALVSIVGTGAFGFFVASTYSLQDLIQGEAMAAPSLIDLGVFLIGLFGFATLSFAGDFARKLPVATPGAKVFFLSFVSTFFLPLITGVLALMWLHMAGDSLGSSLTAELLATVAGSAPVWVFVIFVVAAGLSILHLVTSSMYSLSGNLIGILRIPGWVSSLVLSILLLSAVLVPSYLVAVSTLQESVVELVLLVGVVAAAWAGIVVSDALIRVRGYHEVSLTREYGFYGRFNFVNVLGFLLAVALGFGYLNGGPQLSSWTGYFGNFTPEIFELAGSNIGIAMAFGLSALLPVVLGIPRIKKQEKNLTELDQRRQELKEFLDAAQ